MSTAREANKGQMGWPDRDAMLSLSLKWESFKIRDHSIRCAPFSGKSAQQWERGAFKWQPNEGSAFGEINIQWLRRTMADCDGNEPAECYDFFQLFPIFDSI